MNKTLVSDKDQLDVFTKYKHLFIALTDDRVDITNLIQLTLSQAETLQLMLGDAIEELKQKQ